MAILDGPPQGRWYQAQILGDADVTELAELDPATTGAAAQQALRQAVARLLPSALDIYLTARIGGVFSSVRITNIPLGTLGMSLPGPDGGPAALLLWVAETSEQPHAHADGAPEMPLMLSSAIAVHAARRVLGDESHVFDLGEYGRITWTPTRVRIEAHAGVPDLVGEPREFDWHDPVIGNYASTTDPGYGAWLWFTDPVTGEAGQIARPLTPTLSDMHPDTPSLDVPLSPPRPPRLHVPSLALPGQGE